MSRIRTGYSFKTAVGTLEEVAQRLKDIGRTVAPITDRCSVYGYGRWTKICKTLGMRPVYGVELAIASERKHLTPYDHWTFLAKDTLVPIHEMIHKATSGRCFNVPFTSIKEYAITYDEVKDTKGVFKIAGHCSR